MQIVFRVSRLVKKAIKSRFEGFFSPRILRKRIKLGNFAQIPWSPHIIKRRALSPLAKDISLSRESANNSSENDIKNVNNLLQETKAFIKWSIQNKSSFWRKMKLKSKSEKCQNPSSNMTLPLENEFFKSKQNMIASFNL